MSFLKMFDKMDDIIYKPIETLCDWLKAPLEGIKDRRTATIEREQTELKAKIDEANKRLETELAIKEKTEIVKIIKELEAKIDEANKRLETELAVKRETEVVKIITEIEEWKKDKDLARKRAVSDAIIEYQREFTKLNINAISAIGHMQLDLRERVQNMILDKTRQYKDLQDEAKRMAMDEYKTIILEFADEPEIKQNMINLVYESVGIIIHNSKMFLTELTEDLRSVNQSIDLLTQNGQRFIENHLQQFHSLGFSQEELKRLQDNASKMD